MRMLNGYAWPGNLRELQNMIERGVILASNRGLIEEEHLILQSPQAMKPMLPADTREVHAQAVGDEDNPARLLEQMICHKQTLEDLQHELVVSAVERAGGNLSDAAKFLGLSRAQVSYTLKKIRN